MAHGKPQDRRLSTDEIVAFQDGSPQVRDITDLQIGNSEHLEGVLSSELCDFIETETTKELEQAQQDELSDRRATAIKKLRMQNAADLRREKEIMAEISALTVEDGITTIEQQVLAKKVRKKTLERDLEDLLATSSPEMLEEKIKQSEEELKRLNNQKTTVNAIGEVLKAIETDIAKYRHKDQEIDGEEEVNRQIQMMLELTQYYGSSAEYLLGGELIEKLEKEFKAKRDELEKNIEENKSLAMQTDKLEEVETGLGMLYTLKAQLRSDNDSVAAEAKAEYQNYRAKVELGNGEMTHAGIDETIEELRKLERVLYATVEGKTEIDTEALFREVQELNERINKLKTLKQINPDLLKDKQEIYLHIKGVYLDLQRKIASQEYEFDEAIGANITGEFPAVIEPQSAGYVGLTALRKDVEERVRTLQTRIMSRNAKLEADIPSKQQSIEEEKIKKANATQKKNKYESEITAATSELTTLEEQVKTLTAENVQKRKELEAEREKIRSRASHIRKVITMLQERDVAENARNLRSTEAVLGAKIEDGFKEVRERISEVLPQGVKLEGKTNIQEKVSEAALKLVGEEITKLESLKEIAKELRKEAQKLRRLLAILVPLAFAAGSVVHEATEHRSVTVAVDNNLDKAEDATRKVVEKGALELQKAVDSAGKKIEEMKENIKQKKTKKEETSVEEKTPNNTELPSVEINDPIQLPATLNEETETSTEAEETKAIETQTEETQTEEVEKPATEPQTTPKKRVTNTTQQTKEKPETSKNNQKVDGEFGFDE